MKRIHINQKPLKKSRQLINKFMCQMKLIPGKTQFPNKTLMHNNFRDNLTSNQEANLKIDLN